MWATQGKNLSFSGRIPFGFAQGRLFIFGSG